jgi:hypothetical protein
MPIRQIAAPRICKSGVMATSSGDGQCVHLFRDGHHNAHTLAGIPLIVGFCCPSSLKSDQVRHPQRMRNINIDRPVTSLCLSVFAR